ncbi:MAG TPA: hypothetical protein VMU43_04835 [Candidatus Acidoferrum sp.]|nr:hypothetical protein [Candidatus Acidoferrum sp.]
MSSVSSPLGTFFQQAFSPPAADQNSRSQRLQTAAQQPPIPVDTVTISGYIGSLAQSTIRSTTSGQSNLSAATPQSATTPAAQPLNAQALASDSANTGAAASALPAVTQALSNFVGTSQATQEQELAQLDQLLQQLGIDPNSIPLSEQLNMVLYLNDPTALDQLVQSLGQIFQTPPQTSGGSSQTAPIEAAPATSVTVAIPDTASGAQTNGFAAQFQELQQSLAAIGAISSSPSSPQLQSRVSAAGFSYSGNALNVVA